MIKKEFSGNARRARNYIWNAAGRYDFEPPYLAFYPTGAVDLYFNMVIGLAAKWFDLEKLVDFFDSYADSRREDEYNELLWLGIENSVYEKEIGERPILADLRRKRGEEFFRICQNMSRQQMEMQSMLTYDQQHARWSEVTGKRVLLIGKQRKLFEALFFSGNLDTDGLIQRMRELLVEFFRFIPGKKNDSRQGGRLREAILRGLGKRRGRSEKLLLRVGDGGGKTERDVQLTHTAGMRFGFAPEKKDEEYVRAIFGECVYRASEMRILEESLCVDGDAAARLWVCDTERRAWQNGNPSFDSSAVRENSTGSSKGSADSGDTRDVREVLRRMEAQLKKNREYRESRGLLIKESVKHLSAGLDAILSVYARHLPEKSRAGRLAVRQAYRMRILHDPYVFLREGDETENSLSVTLLLDASMSRLHAQELIAAESYVIARSLMMNNIPVQILSYRTIRGFTVLQRLKAFDSKKADGVFCYTAGGWNRDSLAFRLVGRMIKEQDPEGGREHILLILTDASPNDSMPLAVTGARFNGREYEGELSVREAQKAVKELREDGIRTAAIFLGAGAHLDNVHQIFGRAYVRIYRIAQLTDGVSSLIEMMLREDPPD